MTTDELHLENEIISATKEVFDTMIMQEVQEEAPFYGQTGDIDSNISAMIGLGGDLRGLLAIHCTAAVAKGITGSFLGMDVEELDEDVKDAIGEVSNIVAGDLKVFFGKHSIEANLAIPTSVIGKDYKTGGMTNATRVVVPFSTADGKFWVELNYILNN